MMPMRHSLLAALAAATVTPVAAQELRIPTAGGHTIAAVIETAAPAARRPTVLLISGAGAHDRNGYTIRTPRGHNDAFRAISARLVARGLAVVRFDKIGTGHSTGDYRATATTATLAEDVATIVAALRERPEVDPDRVVLLGHSEGGAIAGIVAADDPRIAGVLLLAAPAWTGRRIMAYQFRLAAERESRTVSYTSADLIEAYLVRDARTRLTTEAWYPHFLAYDPLPPMRRIRAPVLILQGERDEAVLYEQSFELAEAIRAGGNPDVTLRLLPDVGHAFVARGVQGTRADPPPIGEEVLRLIEGWIAARLPGM
jgi:pimeloyl-ACP methyl ester carboxylesterase